MKLTTGQEMALKAISDLQSSFKNGGGIAIISGWAGTGKSTALRTLAEDEDLLVLAPTGKAALRVREAAGVQNSMTVHRWLYKPLENKRTGEITFETKEVDELEVPENRTIFVDEASMVTRQMFGDLYRAAKNRNLNLVFIGDGFQLPPVELDPKRTGWNLLGSNTPCHFRVEMTEIVRQALGSPIIRASMEIRDLRSDMPSIGTTIPVISKAQASAKATEIFQKGGMTVCHRNATRQFINAEVRSALGYTERLVRGEPLLVGVNNYAIEAFNGEVLTIDSEPVMVGDKLLAVKDRYSNEACNMAFYHVTVRTISGSHQVLVADREIFGTNGKVSSTAIKIAGKDLSRSVKIKEQREISGWISEEDRKSIVPDPVLNANFGYCLTAHKAQGSQAPDVLVLVEDSVRYMTEEGRRWVYTAATRAERNLTICWY